MLANERINWRINWVKVCIASFLRRSTPPLFGDNRQNSDLGKESPRLGFVSEEMVDCRNFFFLLWAAWGMAELCAGAQMPVITPSTSL